MNGRNRIMKKRTPWINKNYPSVKGWTRSVHMRGPNDKLAGRIYYSYYPPSGNQIRSIKQVNARMEADEIANKTHSINKENTHDEENSAQNHDDVVIVSPPKTPTPDVIDLTTGDQENESKVTNVTLHVYDNVVVHLKPGGGYHIKWNE